MADYNSSYTGAQIDAAVGKANSALADIVDDTTPQLGGELDQNGKSIGGTEKDNGNSGSAKTIDFKLGNHQRVTLTADATLTFTAPTKACMLSLRVIQDGTGDWELTLPSTIRWAGGELPAFTLTASAVDILSLYYDGTYFYGQVGNDFKVVA